jgi:hypothetical protein
MADLNTPEGIEAEILATVGYDVDDDLNVAKRSVAALRLKLDFARFRQPSPKHCNGWPADST